MAYKVSELVRNLNNVLRLSNTLCNIEIEGEIVGYLGPNRSGHIYFDLKDESAVIKCMMFASRCTYEYRQIISEGAHVILGGSLNYHRQFGLSFVFERVSEAGEGARLRALLELRREFEELGMFDEMYKKPIPLFPRTIGLITSGTGAAIGDVVTNAKRNDPYVNIIVAPAKLEGDGAAEDVVRAIKLMDAIGPDVILLTRGGGSKDSLWTFNERIVAQAVFDCATPIVSAIGHDRDASLTDDIADHHESTPTGAALFLTENTGKILEYLDGAPGDLTAAMNRQLKDRRSELKQLSSDVRYNSPKSRLERKKKDLEKHREMLKSAMLFSLSGTRKSLADHEVIVRRSMEPMIAGRRSLLEKYSLRIPAYMDAALKKAVSEKDIYVGLLEGLSPVGRLKSGFSYVSDKDGRNVRSVSGIKAGDELNIRVTDGEIEAFVRDIRT